MKKKQLKLIAAWLSLCLLVGAALTMTACDGKGDENPGETQSGIASGSETDETSEIESETETSPDLPASKGLEITSNGDGTCFVSGLGACTDTDVVIPTVSLDGESVTSIGDIAKADS